jgi:glycerophosphoryl diester phosphodiesterase
MEMGAQMIELDLHQSRDGVPVVIHDTSLRRTAGIRRNVGSLTLREIKRLDVGSWFNPQFKDQRIPTLEEVLELVRDQTPLNVEIKQGNSPYPLLIEQLIKILDAHHLLSTTLISSFHHGIVQEIRQHYPQVFLGYLTHREAFTKILQNARRLGAYSLHIPFRKISSTLLTQSHGQGFKVFCYTVNNAQEMRRFLKLGVDGLYTNYPDRLAKLLSAPI